MSRRIHRERCGDFLRSLLARACGDEEEAFVAGWALHLYADLVVHPWVDSRVSALWRKRKRPPEGYPELWHMRLEWGIDCSLLEQRRMAFLWDAHPRFPRRGDETLLASACSEFYGEDARPDQVRRGEESIEKWMRRLPKLLLWCGKVRPEHRRGPYLLAPFLDGLTGKVLGQWLAGVKSWKTEATLARPWRPSADELREVERLGDDILEKFVAGWKERFASIGELDLEEGIP